VEGAGDTVDAVVIVTEPGASGRVLLANCCCTAATSLGSIPASRMPDPGPSSRAKTGGVVPGRVTGCLAVDAIGSWTVSVVGCAADSTYVAGCAPADSFCADTLLSARTNCRLAFSFAVGVTSAG